MIQREKGIFPLAQIVGKAGMKWETEFPVDQGWVDIYVPIQKGIEHPYAIEVQTGYNLNCSGILQKLERFRKALTKPGLHIGWGDIEETAVRKTIYPKLFVIIPPDFAEFLPLFKPKKISVFLWEGTLEWECKKCREVTLSSGPWKPVTCDSSSCKGKKRSFSLVGLADFSIREPD